MGPWLKKAVDTRRGGQNLLWESVADFPRETARRGENSIEGGGVLKKLKGGRGKGSGFPDGTDQSKRQIRAPRRRKYDRIRGDAMLGEA